MECSPRFLDLFEVVETLAPRKGPENNVFGDHARDPVCVVKSIHKPLKTNSRKSNYWMSSGNPVKRGIDVDIMWIRSYLEHNQSKEGWRTSSEPRTTRQQISGHPENLPYLHSTLYR